MARIPNWLSVSRIALAPVLVALAWVGAAHAFLAVFALALSTDVVDGYLARRFDATSELGAKLDSWGDLLMWSVLPLAGWWLWPDRLAAELPFVVTAIASLGVPVLVGVLRWHRITSYHTWGAKLSAVLIGPGLLVLFATPHVWLFQIATIVLTLSALEELAITAVLPQWRTDVPTLFHALRPARTSG